MNRYVIDCIKTNDTINWTEYAVTDGKYCHYEEVEKEISKLKEEIAFLRGKLEGIESKNIIHKINKNNSKDSNLYYTCLNCNGKGCDHFKEHSVCKHDELCFYVKDHKKNVIPKCIEIKKKQPN